MRHSFSVNNGQVEPSRPQALAGLFHLPKSHLTYAHDLECQEERLLRNPNNSQLESVQSCTLASGFNLEIRVDRTIAFVLRRWSDMARNIVICCDGTANEFAEDNTNVVKLYYVLDHDPARQVTFYHAGLGTMEPNLCTDCELIGND